MVLVEVVVEAEETDRVVWAIKLYHYSLVVGRGVVVVVLVEVVVEAERTERVCNMFYGDGLDFSTLLTRCGTRSRCRCCAGRC